jgi:hypothetical protein
MHEATGTMSLHEVEIQSVVERCIDCIARGRHKERITVRRRSDHGLGGNVAGGPGPVLDDELLAESRGQLLTNYARNNVASSSGSKTNYKTNQPYRVDLRSRNSGGGREHGSTRCQMQKSSAGRFHLA